MIHKFNNFDIPNLYYFEAGNYFTGSRKKLNFRIDSDGKTMQVFTWHGFLCSDLCEKEETNSFPVTADGHKAMLEWLEEVDKHSPE